MHVSKPASGLENRLEVPKILVHLFYRLKVLFYLQSTGTTFGHPTIYYEKCVVALVSGFRTLQMFFLGYGSSLGVLLEWSSGVTGKHNTLPLEILSSLCKLDFPSWFASMIQHSFFFFSLQILKKKNQRNWRRYKQIYLWSWIGRINVVKMSITTQSNLQI